MATISGQAEASKLIEGFSYSAFPNVRSLVLQDVSGHGTRYSMTIELESDRLKPNYRMKIRFDGIRELRLQDFGNRPTRITGFDIVDVSSQQLENVSFKVVDYENNMIRFFCEKAEIDDLRPVSA